MNILFVEPNFPITKRSKNHKNFLPIGLLKLYDYYKSIGDNPKLMRGNKSKTDIGNSFKPTQIMITSLFTYWSKYVKESVEHYKKLFPKAKVIVGGIYASLMPRHCKKYTGCDEVYIGLHKEAEEHASKNHLSYKKLDNPHSIDYQIIHASRGCIRKCHFCGAWKIEPEICYKKSIKNEICSKKLIFYDNNLLANTYIENILNEIIEERENRNFIKCESQSGFDGRILLNKPHIAAMLKKAGFIYPRIAWDHSYRDWRTIKKQIEVLINAGFRSKEIFVFMLYNYEIDFYEMEKKRLKCWEWKIQIADCRYRPLDQTFDNYDPQAKKQASEDYYVHYNWTDAKIRQFRRNIRKQNMCIRQDLRFYSRTLENKKVDKELSLKLKQMSRKEVEMILSDVWYPDINSI